VTTWKFSSRERIALYYVVVSTRGVTRQMPCIKYVTQNIERLPGTSVYALYATLDKPRWKEQKYSIEVTCKGIGRFSFRAYDPKSKEIKLDSTVFGERQD
jgi:hypothetical protein